MTPFMTAVQFCVDRADGYAWEGGYSNDRLDPGGETNFGISKRAHPDVDIKNLTVVGAMEIYKRDYWDAYHLGNFTIPLCVVMFDAYVQHRPTVVEGFIKIAAGDWKLFNASRRTFYLRLVDKYPDKYSRFKNGWLNRMNSLDKYCQIVMQDNQ